MSERCDRSEGSGRSDDASFDALIGDVYSAALEGEWDTVLRRLSRALHRPTLSLLLPGMGGLDLAGLVGPEFDPDLFADYFAYFHQVDPYAPHWDEIRPGVVMWGESVVDSADLRRGEFFADWVEPQGFQPEGNFVYCLEQDDVHGWSVLGSWQRRGERLPEARDEALLHDLAPHLRRALRIHSRIHRLERHADSLERALEALPRGVMLVDARGAPTFVNAAGRRLLAGDDGGAIGREAMALAHRAEHPRRQLGSPDAGVEPRMVARGQGRAPLELLVAPLPFGIGSSGSARSIVFLGDPEQPLTPPTDRLRRLYGLTPAEARLVVDLVDGASLAEAAHRAGITVETGRGRLKHVMAKLGVSRQKDLVRRVYVGVASLASASGHRFDSQ